MTGPSMKNSTETSRQRIEWCWAPIRMSYILYESMTARRRRVSVRNPFCLLLHSHEIDLELFECRSVR